MDDCKGCVYDLNKKTMTVEEFLDTCCVCKRAMLDDFKDKFKDMYRSKEDVNNE